MNAVAESIARLIALRDEFRATLNDPNASESERTVAAMMLYYTREVEKYER